jgi:hypothetical protein
MEIHISLYYSQLFGPVNEPQKKFTELLKELDFSDTIITISGIQNSFKDKNSTPKTDSEFCFFYQSY